MGRATVLLVFWTLSILFVEVLLLLQGHNFLNSTPSLWFSRFSNSLTEFGQLTNNFVLLTTASYKGKINWIQQLSTINKMNLLILDYFLKFGDLNRSLSIRDSEKSIFIDKEKTRFFAALRCRRGVVFNTKSLRPVPSIIFT